MTRCTAIPLRFLLLDLNPELAVHDRSALKKKEKKKASVHLIGCAFKLQVDILRDSSCMKISVIDST